MSKLTSCFSLSRAEKAHAHSVIGPWNWLRHKETEIFSKQSWSMLIFLNINWKVPFFLQIWIYWYYINLGPKKNWLSDKLVGGPWLALSCVIIYLCLYVYFFFSISSSRYSVRSANWMKFPQIMILYSVMVHATVLSTKNALNLPWILKVVSSTHFFSCEVFSTELRNKWIVSKVFCTFDNLHFCSTSRRSGMVLQVLWMQDGYYRSYECSFGNPFLRGQQLAGYC
jgi:hypothetical protein